MPDTDKPLVEIRSLYRAGDYAQAALTSRALLGRAGESAEALNLLGLSELRLGNFRQSLEAFERSLAGKPAQAVICLNRGHALQSLARNEEALGSFEAALALRPDYSKAHLARVSLLRRGGRLGEALAACEQWLAADPSAAEAFNLRGNVLTKLGRTDEAIADYRRAVDLRPAFPAALNNLAKALKDKGRFREALASYEAALALRPDYAMAHINKALLLLLMGDYRAGWRLFEWRWKSVRAAKNRDYPVPRWLGDEDIRGRRLLVWGEQGYGDLIQFSRFIPVLAGMGIDVCLEAPRSLVPLLETLDATFEIREMNTRQESGFDRHCPLMSLPFALGITLDNLPGSSRYLAAPPAAKASWAGRLGRPQRFRVGLAWSGSTAHANDRNRSLALAALKPLLALDVEFHVVQKDIRQSDLTVLAASAISTHEGALLSFADTAALIEAMDLVISVDSSPAHLAGALGKPVWVLLPFVPDYRWLLERADSPWYASARLFRQPAAGDWDAVVRQLVAALAVLLPGEYSPAAAQPRG